MFKDLLRIKRKNKHLSQKCVGSMLRISQEGFSKYELGRIPRFATVIKIAKCITDNDEEAFRLYCEFCVQIYKDLEVEK